MNGIANLNRLKCVLMPHITMLSGPVLLSLICVLLAPTALATDDRAQFNADSPPWLSAVGRLHVPGQRREDGHLRHHIETCSATLVSGSNAQHAQLILTAWHCLEFYRDLSRPIRFSLPEAIPDWSTRASLLEQGGDIQGDWALLRLAEPVPPSRAAGLSVDTELDPGPGLGVIMAGYSRDAGIGARGERLSYDAHCRVTGREYWWVNTDCTAFKGASGGAVVSNENQTRPQLIGVISQGDGERTSTFVPAIRFRAALQAHLEP